MGTWAERRIPTLINRDKRSKVEKHIENKNQTLVERLRKKFSSQALRVCEEKLAHYEKMGNARKADIYRRKVEEKRNFVTKLASRLNPR